MVLSVLGEVRSAEGTDSLSLLTAHREHILVVAAHLQTKCQFQCLTRIIMDGDSFTESIEKHKLTFEQTPVLNAVQKSPLPTKRIKGREQSRFLAVDLALPATQVTSVVFI